MTESQGRLRPRPTSDLTEQDGLDEISLLTASDSTLSSYSQQSQAFGKAVAGALWSIGKFEWLATHSSGQNPTVIVFKMLSIRKVGCNRCADNPIRLSVMRNRSRSFCDVMDGIFGSNCLFYCDECREDYMQALRENTTEICRACEKLVHLIRKGPEQYKVQAIDYVTALISFHRDFAVFLRVLDIKDALEEVLIDCSRFTAKDSGDILSFRPCQRALVSIEEAFVLSRTRTQECRTSVTYHDLDAGIKPLNSMIKSFKSDAYRPLVRPDLVEFLDSAHADQDLLRTLNPGISPALEVGIAPAFVEFLWQLADDPDPVDRNSSCGVLRVLYRSGCSGHYSATWQWKSLWLPLLRACSTRSLTANTSVFDDCLSYLSQYLKQEEDILVKSMNKSIVEEARRLGNVRRTYQKDPVLNGLIMNVLSLVDLASISHLKVYRHLALSVAKSARELNNSAILQTILEEMEGNDRVSAVGRSHDTRSVLITLHRSMLPYAPPEKMIQEMIRRDERELLDLIQTVLNCEADLARILSLTENEAAEFLDLLQWAMDTCHTFGSEHQIMGNKSFSRQLSSTLITLSQGSQRVPSSLLVEDVRLSIIEPITGGGFADVFMASHNGGTVALKRLRVFHGSANERIKIRKKFCKEAFTWQQLRHRCVLPFLGIDAVTFAPLMCMVSPWMSNGNVLQYIERCGPLDVNINIILCEIAEGLGYLHEFGLVHGDLRGANILVDSNGHAKLSDFGLTGIVDGTSRSSSGCGSIRWMAPELINPRAFPCKVFKRTMASDIYSFACVCLELYTLRMPFSSLKHDTTVIIDVINGVRPSLPSVQDCHGRAMPEELWGLITSCWIEDPSRRPGIHEALEMLHYLSAGTAKKL